ncbi:hypothetical protein D3C72_2105100 [compost metagenome]
MQAGDQGLRHFALVMLMRRNQGLVQAKARQQVRCVARIFTGDGIGKAQQMQRAQADIGHIADRRGHYIQCCDRIDLVRRLCHDGQAGDGTDFLYGHFGG